MAISGIGSSSLSAFSQLNQKPSNTEMAQKMLKDMDADQNGAVSKTEFVAFGERIKAQSTNVQNAGGAPPTAGANAPQAVTPDQMFSNADRNGDQSLSVDELASMLAKGETDAKARGQAGGARGAGGPPPGGPPPGGAQPAGGSQGSGAASSSKSISSSDSTSSESSDPADSNHDGVVSAAEKLIYELAHPDASSSSNNTTPSPVTSANSAE